MELATLTERSVCRLGFQMGERELVCTASGSGREREAVLAAHYEPGSLEVEPPPNGSGAVVEAEADFQRRSVAGLPMGRLACPTSRPDGGATMSKSLVWPMCDHHLEVMSQQSVLFRAARSAYRRLWNFRWCLPLRRPQLLRRVQSPQ